MEINKMRKRKLKESVEIKSQKEKFEIKSIFKNMIKFFKHKEIIYRKSENEYHEYLRKFSFDSSGVVDYKDDCIVTRNGKQYKIFKLEFKEQNGLDEIIDRDNFDGLIQIQDVLIDDYAIIFPQEHKYNLQNNIDFYRNCLENEIIDSRKEIIEENIRLMNKFNEIKYVSIIMAISISDVEKFKKIASLICNIIEYDKKETELYLDQLNNEIQ